MRPLGLADLDPRESGDVHATGGKDLLDRSLRVLDEGLLNQRDVLVEGTKPTLDDLRDRLLRLALVAGDLLRDPALLLHDIRGHFVAADVERPHRGDLLGKVL